MSGFPRILTEALAAKIAAAVPAIAKVYPEWPEKNQPLTYPALTIVSAAPQYMRGTPYLVTQGATNVVTNKATDIYCVGTWDIALQLDLWTRYKVERDTLYNTLWQMLEPALPQGFMVQLTSYYNEWASIAQTGFKFIDTEDSVTRKEWRALVQIQACCRAMNTVSEYIITQPPVLQFDTPDTIP